MSDLLAAVRSTGLIAAATPIVVMYSGGRDSTCLLDVVVRITGAPAVTALHVNYGLRDAAAADEEHCRRTCGELGVALHVRRVVAPPTGNVQAWARAERYAAATELAQARDADVAAGHTATDQVETILYRLASSPSRRALLGMRARDGRVIRPLLQFTRAKTGEHCRGRGLDWREDESNASDAYARSRIRHGLVPALEAAHPAAVANVLAVAEILRQEALVLDELVDQVLAGGHEIGLDRLRELPPALRRLVVQRLADETAGGPAAGVARRADDVAAMAPRGFAALDLPGGVRATARDGTVRFGRTPTGGRRGRPGSGDGKTRGAAPT
ncbi:MAG TPA: tRNA lysidine(34) synthetase TilS [Solirubrobacteraceae bacterium]